MIYDSNSPFLEFEMGIGLLRLVFCLFGPPSAAATSTSKLALFLQEASGEKFATTAC